MQGKYKTICLCGTTKYKDAYTETQKALSLKGCIVISVGLFGHSGDAALMDESTKTMLDDMHKRKIDMSDAIVVVDVPTWPLFDVEPYVGNSTASEIQYAKTIGKQIFYLSKMSSIDEVAALNNLPKQYSCTFCYGNKLDKAHCDGCVSHRNFEWSCEFCKHVDESDMTCKLMTIDNNVNCDKGEYFEFDVEKAHDAMQDIEERAILY